MKTINRLAIVSFFILVLTQNYFSQNTVVHASVARPIGESWLPLNEFNSPQSSLPQKTANGYSLEVAPPLTNVLNGVSFYIMNGVCNKDSVILVRLINSNDYAVKVSWQVSKESAAQNITIPALKLLDGGCSNQNNTTTKLALKQLIGPDKEKVKKYIISHISVTPFKKGG